MADRVVNVTLSVQVAEYLAGMEKASKATKAAAAETQKLAEKKQAVQLLGRTAFVAGSLIAAGIGLAVVRAADFDQAMSNVNAVMQETTENQEALRQAALDFGASSVFTASESANAIEELGKAGLSTADILSGALAGSLDLASAGQLGIARAAEISATTLQQFGLAGDQAGRVADTLAAGAGKAMGSVEDLAQGLKFVGPIAAAMGVSLEETTGVLAMFAQQGIIGEQAGTSLRGMLSSLTSPSSLAKKEIAALGITLYDNQGKFLGMGNAAGQLSKAYSGLTDEQRDMSLGMIFGNQQITAARVLYKGGAEGVKDWTDAVEDSGYAAQVARDRLDNLKGDVEQLGGAFDTALITTGSAANDVLRAMTQTLTDVIDLYNDAPEPVKVATLAVAGVAAAALLASGAFFLVVPKVQQFNAALATLGPNAQKAGALLTASAGPIGAAFAAAGIAIAIFAGKQADAKAKTEAFSDTLDQQTGAIQQSTKELAKANLSAKGTFLGFDTGADSVFDAAKKVGLSLDVVTEAALGSTESLEQVRDRVKEIEAMDGDALSKAFGDDWVLAEAKAKQVADAVKGESDSLEEAIRVTKQKASIDKDAAKKADEHTKALDMLEGKADSTGDAIAELADQIRGFGSAALSTREANRNLEEAYDSLTESINENGTSLDIGTDAGRANEDALDNIAKAAKEAAASTYEQTNSQEQANEVLKAGRARLIEMLAPFGIVGDAAEAYADDLGLIPENVATAVSINVGEADAELKRWVRNVNGIKIEVVPVVGGRPINAGQYASGAVVDFYANGGMRENHVAQIAPAGAWRVWAEPETGGESYIPLAMSKRARSLDIWAETGKRLGVQGFANGGVQYASAPSRYMSTPAVPNVYINAPIVSDSGTLEGYVTGVAGRVTDLKFEREIGRAHAANAGRRI